MSKSTKIFIVTLLVAILAGAGIWYYLGGQPKSTNLNETETSSSKPESLKQLVEKSDIVLTAITTDNGEARTTTEGDTQRSSTDYAMKVLKKYRPDYDIKLDRFYLSINKSTGIKLEKASRYIVFAVFNQDGRLRPSGNELGIARITGDKDKDIYTFPDGLFADNKTAFIDSDLTQALTESTSTQTYTIGITKKQ